MVVGANEVCQHLVQLQQTFHFSFVYETMTMKKKERKCTRPNNLYMQPFERNAPNTNVLQNMKLCIIKF